jgi:methylmalonyl-CoA/ethylmalonyl-CoA epimerase
MRETLYDEESIKVKKLDHISIAVRDLEAARRAWEPILGKSEPESEQGDG